MRTNYRSQARASSIVIFDTSVLIDHLRTGCHQQRIDSISRLIRTSVVLAELWRGATKSEEHRFLHALAWNHPILPPTEKMGSNQLS
jgi:predicted nucleic acid-binding protein